MCSIHARSIESQQQAETAAKIAEVARLDRLVTIDFERVEERARQH
jgi:hypothetical protein